MEKHKLLAKHQEEGKERCGVCFYSVAIPFFHCSPVYRSIEEKKNDRKIMLAHVTLYNMIVQDKTEGATIHIGMNHE